MSAEEASVDTPIRSSSAKRSAPVFIVGSARSGNTMLYSMLMSSGCFPVYRTEPCVFDLLIPRFGDFGTLEKRRELMHSWVRSKQFRASGLNATEITEKVLSSVKSGGDFLSIVMGEMARARGFQRWAAWGPDNLLFIPAIKRQIPDALFIHVIRDGRDVAHALDRKKFIRPFPWDRDLRLYVSALHWYWKVRLGRHYGRAIGMDYLEVRFEDLITSPNATLKSIAEFVGDDLDYEKVRQDGVAAMQVPNTSFPDELKSGAFSPIGRWKRELPADAVAQLEALVGDLLLELGYPLLSDGRTPLGFRLRTLKTTYPAFEQTKLWLKTATPLGRFVNINRLRLDQKDGSSDSDVNNVSVNA